MWEWLKDKFGYALIYAVIKCVLLGTGWGLIGHLISALISASVSDGFAHAFQINSIVSNIMAVLVNGIMSLNLPDWLSSSIITLLPGIVGGVVGGLLIGGTISLVNGGSVIEQIQTSCIRGCSAEIAKKSFSQLSSGSVAEINTIGNAIGHALADHYYFSSNSSNNTPTTPDPNNSSTKFNQTQTETLQTENMYFYFNSGTRNRGADFTSRFTNSETPQFN